MFPFLLSPITKYAVIAAAVLAAISSIYLKGRSDGKDVLRPKLEAAQSDVLLWQKTAENREILLNAQNKAVERLKDEGERTRSTYEKKLAVANSEASKIRKEAQKSATTILTMKATGNECKDLSDLVDAARGMR